MFQVSAREGVRNIVPEVGQLVKKYGDPFLSGCPEFYDELQKANYRATVEFEREQMSTRIRKEADAACGLLRIFARAAELLQPIKGDLTEIESKRLAYAEKPIRKTATATDEEISKRR